MSCFLGKVIKIKFCFPPENKTYLMAFYYFSKCILKILFIYLFIIFFCSSSK